MNLSLFQEGSNQNYKLDKNLESSTTVQTAAISQASEHYPPAIDKKSSTEVLGQFDTQMESKPSYANAVPSIGFAFENSSAGKEQEEQSFRQENNGNVMVMASNYPANHSDPAI